jgi:uncharacterized protein YndB with AHSA1/START domain
MFDTPRNLVFRAWTEPVHAACWFGPQGSPFWGGMAAQKNRRGDTSQTRIRTPDPSLLLRER